ncbi:MAG: peptidase E [Tissierellia bacterium]|nr:peptidase E [Tissierellia bacterium]
MDKYIVAIGGGEIKNGDTDKINEYIVSLSKSERPKLLFIPTASNDAIRYIESVEEHFRNLGCEVSSLCLYDEYLDTKSIKKRIMSSDIIYIGGGNTITMLEKWREYGVDKYLKDAYESGVIMSGLSAGSICWFTYGHSDSNRFTNPDFNWDYVRAYGLGLIEGAHCPHYNEPGREQFDIMMENEEELLGIAVEDGAAVVYKNDEMYVIRETEDKKAYKFYREDDILLKEELI